MEQDFINQRKEDEELITNRRQDRVASFDNYQLSKSVVAKAPQKKDQTIADDSMSETRDPQSNLRERHQELTTLSTQREVEVTDFMKNTMRNIIRED